MGTKADIDGENTQQNTAPKDAVVAHNTTDSEGTPPVYYNSEPSSQPPQYPGHHAQLQWKAAGSTSVPPTIKPPNRHRDSAPATTIHAISPYIDLDAERRAERNGKSLRQRLKGFVDRNFRNEYEDPDGQQRHVGSAPKLNVFGAGLKGGTVTPYEKKGRK